MDPSLSDVLSSAEVQAFASGFPVMVMHLAVTLLLLAALSLAAMSGQYPFVVGWVTAKVLGLTAYIVLGALALRDANTLNMRIVCWLAAMGAFGWIVSVALTRHPAGFVAALF